MSFLAMAVAERGFLKTRTWLTGENGDLFTKNGQVDVVK